MRIHAMNRHATERGFDPLPWDSDLFGFAVARLNSSDVPKAIAEMRQAGIRLAYASVDFADEDAKTKLESTGALLVDRKVRFRKVLASNMASVSTIRSWIGRPCTPELEALALASGHVSRFHVDQRIPFDVFRTLYVTWIRRSVSGEIADEVFVLDDSGLPVGMVTLARPGPASDAGIIGLIAVAEGSRGRGYGKRLVSAAESWCLRDGATALEVVTQGQNSEACALYAACGFQVIADEAVYHLWIEP